MLYQTQAAPQSKFNGLIFAPNSNKEEGRHCRCSQNNKNGKLRLGSFSFGTVGVHMNIHLQVNVHQIH